MCDISVEHYEKGEVSEVDVRPSLHFMHSCIHMKVTNGSKIKNLMGFAMKKIKVFNVKLNIAYASKIKYFYNIVIEGLKKKKYMPDIDLGVDNLL